MDKKGKFQLIKTGMTTGLSQPISFESISTEEPQDPNANMITTNFATAINFIIPLIRRETEDGCADYNGTVLDEFHGDMEETDKRAQWGYIGDLIKGLSTSWATDVEMERFYALKKGRKTDG
jgi:hypothetical protein